MGKKGGKKGKLDKIVENAEPNLPTIPEEEPLEKSDEVKADEPAELTDKEKAAKKSQSTSKSHIKVSHSKSKTKTIPRDSKVLNETQDQMDSQMVMESDQLEGKMPLSEDLLIETKADGGEKKKKSGKKGKKEMVEASEGEDMASEEKPKKGKKDKKEKPQGDGETEEEEKPKKGKKARKEKPEGDGETGEEEKPKKGKKAKKEKPEGDSEIEEEKSPKKNKKGKKAKAVQEENVLSKPEMASSKPALVSSKPALVSSKPELRGSGDEATTDEKIKKKGKKGKKGGDEAVGEQEPKKKKGKKDKQKETGEGESETKLGKSKSSEGKSVEHVAKKSSSKTRKSKSKTSVSEAKSADALDERSKYQLKKRESSLRVVHRNNRASEDSASSDKYLKRKSSSRLTGRDGSYAVLVRKNVSSKMSAISSISTFESDELVSLKERVKKKRKKGKKQKDKAAQKDGEEPPPEETEEEKERKRAEKEAEKQAKKEAKKAAKKEAAAKRKAEKAEKKSAADVDDLKKKVEDLKRVAKEMGMDESKVDLGDGQDKGPKKKGSKKEKSKMTAEMVEKAKADMEAQAKRMEELIRKRKEEERMAAMEKDKREIVEQGMRMEQLLETAVVLQEIVDTNAELSKQEKDLTEWNKYVECGKLPNPAMCDQMNTYLHLWELDLEKTGIEDASSRTTDAIKLLSDLDELIDTITPDDEHKLPNWKWIRQLFREYQAASLDVATYRLLRDVEHNLNRINIPTADFNFKDDYVTLCLWLRVMLPIPLPNPRRPPKPRIDISFKLMDFSVAFPTSIDFENAAIRCMYLKYDHLSDLSDTFNMPQVPEDYYMDLLSIVKKEWRIKLLYKYENRDRKQKLAVAYRVSTEPNRDSKADNQTEGQKPEEAHEEEKKIKFEEPEIGPDDDIPIVPFKQLKPTASEHAINLEDILYDETRTKLRLEFPENVINLRKFVILGGVFHLNLLAQPPQPQDFVTMEMTITGLYLPKKLELLPFKVVYTPYVPPEPEPTDSNTSIRKLPEELEQEMKKQEEELDKLISINVKWPPHVIFLELPVVCRWDEDKKQWSNEEIIDVKHNEDKCMLSFRTGVFGIYGLATCRYANLPFQAYDIKPEIDDSVTVQLTAAILMLEFNIKDGLIAITQLQNSPNMTLQDVVGKYMKLHQLKRMMKEAGIDIFPAFDAFCYVDGCDEKQWAMEQHLYYNMAQISNCFNFSWSRWNLQAGRRKIVLQMREYSSEKGKQKNHQMMLVTPLKAAFIECTEVSQAFSENEVESLRFCADLYHLMRITSGIFVRNKVSKASKQNVYTLAQFLISIRVLSFS